MHTGENEQGLRKLLDFTRIASLIILFLHIYYHFYKAFEEWKLTSTISDNLLINIRHTGLFDEFNTSKHLALLLLVISLIGVRGKKIENINYQTIAIYIITGTVLYYGSIILRTIQANAAMKTYTYSGVTAIRLYFNLNRWNTNLKNNKTSFE